MKDTTKAWVTYHSTKNVTSVSPTYRTFIYYIQDDIWVTYTYRCDPRVSYTHRSWPQCHLYIHTGCEPSVTYNIYMWPQWIWSTFSTCQVTVNCKWLSSLVIVPLTIYMTSVKRAMLVWVLALFGGSVFPQKCLNRPHSESQCYQKVGNQSQRSISS